MVLNTRHTGFVVNNLDKFISFYEGLGLKLISRMIEKGDYIDNLVSLKNVKLEWAKLALPDSSVIELLKYHSHPDLINEADFCQNANRNGCSHIALTVSNIQQTIDYICSNGGSIKNNYQISPDGNVKVAYCYDMEGNILEIVEILNK
jgi:catechol 2,3-dioxygenase-like lactoylglutathione lyase family enzyme